MPYAADSADISVSDKKWWHWLEPIQPLILKFIELHAFVFIPLQDMIEDLKKISVAFPCEFGHSYLALSSKSPQINEKFQMYAC